jgi:tRNA (guanine37-N1)-methyltransferase
MTMRFDVVSLFPEVFEPVFRAGVVGRAIDRGLLELHAHDLREHTHDRHRQVDDVPYGGGPGMVLKPEPLFEAIEAIRAQNPGPVILMEPWGEPLTQLLARELAAEPGLVIVCGRYEGIDDRVRESLADREISIGDYVLSGGELPAMVVIDAVSRLIPGVLGDEDSLAGDSFTADLLGHPQYTRPAEYRGLRVPEVLLSGNHREIEAWRQAQALRRTLARAGTPQQGDRKR